jgi:hypothetical protein
MCACTSYADVDQGRTCRKAFICRHFFCDGYIAIAVWSTMIAALARSFCAKNRASYSKSQAGGLRPSQFQKSVKAPAEAWRMTAVLASEKVPACRGEILTGRLQDCGFFTCSYGYAVG